MKTFSPTASKFSKVLIGLVLAASPIFVLAATATDCNSQAAPAGQLPNPLQVCSINDILYLAVDIATYVGVVLAVIFLIYAGFKYVAARGNPEKIKEAHHFLLGVVIGIAILIGASAIVNVIKTTLTSAGVVSSNAFNAPPGH
jgi:type IV secretory pathway VirB2 component (pilin)